MGHKTTNKNTRARVLVKRRHSEREEESESERSGIMGRESAERGHKAAGCVW